MGTGASMRRFMNAFPTFFSRQARKPTGLFGRWFMAKVFTHGNMRMNTFVYESMAISPRDRILEVGYGTGTLMEMVAKHLDGGVVEGVDFSRAMHGACGKRNKRFVDRGTVKLHCGDFDTMELPQGCFDKAFTVNTVYFWREPRDTLARLHGLLKPGGRLYIGFNDKQDMRKMPLNDDIFTYYTVDDMRELLAATNLFSEVSVLTRDPDKVACHCAVAVR